MRGGSFGPDPSLAHFRDSYESHRTLFQEKCAYFHIYKFEPVISGEVLKFILHEPQDWNCWAGISLGPFPEGSANFQVEPGLWCLQGQSGASRREAAEGGTLDSR